MLREVETRQWSVGSPAHPDEVRQVLGRIMAEAQLKGFVVRTADGAAVHAMATGTGPSVVFIHGSGSPGLFWLPVLQHLESVRAVVVDRPGFGLSEPVAPAATSKETAVGWIDRLLDALELPSAILVGHSMGGLWSLRFALARPERVRGLAMLGAPSLPGTQAPLPYRLMGTPGVGPLISRQRETPKSVRQFARMVGEGDTIGAHPAMVDLLVAVGNDPVAGRALHEEVRALISPAALLSRSGFRRRARITEADLQGVEVPTLLLVGDRDPVGGADVARRHQSLIPHSELKVFNGGHAPWLGQPHQVASVLADWVQRVDANRT